MIGQQLFQGTVRALPKTAVSFKRGDLILAMLL
jgi:hypothetical protein